MVNYLNLKVGRYVLQWRKVHTKIHDNRSSGPRVKIRVEEISRHTKKACWSQKQFSFSFAGDRVRFHIQQAKKKAFASPISRYFFFLWRCGPTRAMASSFLRFLDHTQRRITVGTTPLEEWSARAETSTWQHTTLTTNIHAPGGIRTHDLSRRAVADLRLRPCGHWDRQFLDISSSFLKYNLKQSYTLIAQNLHILFPARHYAWKPCLK